MGAPSPGRYILTIAPNPALDRFLEVPGFRPGEIHRPKRVIEVASGKALNVTRTIHRLGGAVRTCALLGGLRGRWVAEQLDWQGIPARITWGKGETRVCTTVIDPLAGKTTSFYEYAQAIEAGDWFAFEHNCLELLPEAVLVVLSGSIPPGAPAEGLARIVAQARSQDIPVLADTYGPALSTVLKQGLLAIKINQFEAEDLLSTSIGSKRDALQAARSIQQLGAHAAILTLGKAGAVAVTGEGAWRISAPRLKVVNPVGSGDAWMAGMALGLARQEGWPQAFRLGAAAAAANTQTLAAGDLEPDAVLHFLEQVQVSPI